MRLRIVRLSAIGLLLGVLGLPGTRASATTVQTVTFQGVMSTDAGLGDPCTTSDPNKPCPPNATTTTTTDYDGLPVTNVAPGGNTRAIGWGSSVCLDAGVHLAPGKTPAEAGTCGFAGSGAITGFCTIATASGTGFLYNSLGQHYDITWNMTWTGYAGTVFTMYLTGVATKADTGETGSIRGEIVGILGQGRSCLDKSASVWELTGDVVIRMGV